MFEIYTSLRFFFDYARGKPDTRSKKDTIEKGHVDFDQAFGCAFIPFLSSFVTSPLLTNASFDL